MSEPPFALSEAFLGKLLACVQASKRARRNENRNLTAIGTLSVVAHHTSITRDNRCAMHACHGHGHPISVHTNPYMNSFCAFTVSSPPDKTSIGFHHTDNQHAKEAVAVVQWRFSGLAQPSHPRPASLALGPDLPSCRCGPRQFRSLLAGPKR